MNGIRSWVGTHRRISVLRKAFTSSAQTTYHDQDELERTHLPVSIVNDVRTASQAIEALLKLPDGTTVAWSSQALPPRTSPAMMTMCAYAGNAFQDGAGAFVCPSSGHEAAVWGLFREYFQDRMAKAVCFDMEKFTSHLFSRGIEARGCLHDVQAMLRISGLKEKSFDSYVKKVVSKHARDKRESMIGFQDRPWDLPTYDMRLLSDGWISSAYGDAYAIFHMYGRMKTKMLKKGLFSGEAKNCFEAYERFYAQIEKSLCTVGNQGLFLDDEMLCNVLQRFENDRRSHQSIFESWAKIYCDEVSQVDITTSMLRHILFAPYQNIQNKSERTPTEKTFSARERDMEGNAVGITRGKRSPGKKRKILVRGAGLAPEKYTSNGVPSVNMSALQSVVKALSSSQEPKLQTAYSAINGLQNARTLKLAAQNFEKGVKQVVDSEGQVRMMTKTDFEKGQLWTNVCANVFEVLRAKKDHELVVLQFENLNLCALADLSDCERLKERLRLKDGAHAYLAKEFSKEIAHALYDGSCVLEGEGVTVRRAFPEKFHMARMLDVCMSKGARVEIVKSVMKCDAVRASQLMNGWFQVHPAVKLWHDREAGKIRNRKVAETLQGRQRALKLRKGRRAAVAVNEGMTFTIEGSAGDFMMQSVLKIVHSERINALAWRIIFADANRIVLQGPRWSSEEAAPAVLDTLVSSSGGGAILESALHQLRILRGENFRALRRLS